MSYAKSSVVDGVYKANIDLGDAVDKGADDFRNKEGVRLRLQRPEQGRPERRTYTKEGDKWKSGGKVMDNTTVQNLDRQITRSEAPPKFAEKSRRSPIFEATVTSNGGKRAEKVP